MDNVYSSVDHKYNEPLIVLIDEVDIILNKITQTEPLYHKKYPIMIKNKIREKKFILFVLILLVSLLLFILEKNWNRKCLNLTQKT